MFPSQARSCVPPPRRLFVLVMALALVAAPSAAPVFAQDPEPTSKAVEDAKGHYERGAKAYDLGYFEEAYREFEAGYRASPRPAFLLNMAHTQRRMGNLRKARELYSRYILIEPDSPAREGVKQLIGDLDQAIAAEDRDSPDAGAGRSQPIEPLVPDAGASRGDGGFITVIPTPPAPDTAVPVPASRPIYKRWWFWTGVGAVAIVAATAITLGVLASRPDFVSSGSIGTLGPDR